MKLIDKSEPTCLSVRLKKAICAFSAAISVAAGGTVGICFAVDRGHYAAYCALLCVWLALSGCACIFVFTAFILPLRRRCDFLRGIFSAPPQTYVCTVRSVGDVITVKAGEKATEIVCEIAGVPRKFYMLSSGAVCTLNVGETYGITTADGFIIDCEAAV